MEFLESRDLRLREHVRGGEGQNELRGSEKPGSGFQGRNRGGEQA
jgi:hypothetical protein